MNYEDYEDFEDFEAEVIEAQDSDIANNTVVEDSDREKVQKSGVTVSEKINFKHFFFFCLLIFFFFSIFILSQSK